MTYTAINKATAVISGGTISKSAFGDPVCDNFADHETRILANESDIRSAANALTVIRDSHGRYYRSSSIAAQNITNSLTAILFDATEDTPAGVSYSAGVFTIAAAGRYNITANLFGTGPVSTITFAGLAIGPSTSIQWAYQLSSIPSTSPAPTVVINAAANNVTFAAGGTFSVYAINTSGTLSLPTGQTAHGCNVGIQRVG